MAERRRQRQPPPERVRGRHVGRGGGIKIAALKCMGWQLFAVISAVAAGVTVVFAKAGLEGVPSHLGNAVRTAVMLGLALGVLWWSGEHQKTDTLNGRAWLFLALSGLATAISWVAYFKALSLGAGS